jgi:hypothetical protein
MLRGVIALVSVAAFAATPCDITVSPANGDDSASGREGEPLASVHEAARRLQTLVTDGQAAVCLAPGVHTLSGKPLKLEQAHNVQGRKVIWKAADSSRKTTLSAGAPLTKWVRCDDGVHCPYPQWHGVWVHMVADVPAIKSVVPIRQLWVNGRTYTRQAITTGSLGLVPTATGYTSKAPIPWFASAVANQVELRWPSQIKNWIEPRCVVTAATENTLTVAESCWKALTARHGGLPPAPLFIENASPGAVDPPAPGEFYATDLYIFYKPSADDPYAIPTDAWAPVQSTLIEGHRLQNHEFSNLTFSHTTWRQPSTQTGYVPSQSTGKWVLSVCRFGPDPQCV